MEHLPAISKHRIAVRGHISKTQPVGQKIGPQFTEICQHSHRSVTERFWSKVRKREIQAAISLFMPKSFLNIRRPFRHVDSL